MSEIEPPPPHEWKGDKIVANGRIYYAECDECGWPQSLHPRVYFGSRDSSDV